MNVRFVELDSPEYFSLCDLRYRVFFEKHGLPRAIVSDVHEKPSWYAVITMAHSTDVLACGRLTAVTTEEYQISQMAVEPAWQGKKLGKTILLILLEKASDANAKSVIVDARTSAIGFYKRCGFVIVSDEFPSAKTGIPHVIMRKKFDSDLHDSEIQNYGFAE